jgi:choline kinase
MAFSLLETGCIKAHQNILVLYGDCIYEASVIRSLLQKGLQYPHGPTLAIDKEWLNLWKKRFDNPLSDCETLSLKDDMIIEIGQKPTTLDGIEGQYTGLFFIPQSCIPLFQETYKTLKITQEDSRKEKLFLTDVFQAWIHEKKPLFFHAIHGGWLECDQHSDLILYESLYKQNKLEEIYHINDLFR